MPGSSLRERIRQLEQLLLADPDNVAVRQQLLREQTRFLTEAGDPEVSRALAANLEVLYALSPRDPLAAEILAQRVDPEYHPAPPLDAEAREAFAAGLQALESGQLEAAETAWRAALLAEPDAPAVHLGLARLALQRSAPTAARPHLEFALARAPRSAQAAALAAEERAAAGAPAAAFELVVKALCLNPLCVTAEQLLVRLGEPLGYRVLRLPIPPGVWPLISPAGESWLVPAEGVSPAARAAWRRWAVAVVRLCRDLPVEATPLAGLPRRLPLLLTAYQELLRGWRRTAWRRWLPPRRPRSDEALLAWLAAVEADNLLPAYLYYCYLHPDLAGDFRAWQAREPEAMERFVRTHLVQPVSEKP